MDLIAQVQRWVKQISRRRQLQGLLLLLLLGLTLRSLPYLAPIRASDLAQDDQALSFSDRRGLPLGTVLTRTQEQTASVPLDQVSANFIQAIIAAEDQRFYQHGAVDLQAVGRALLEAAQARQIVSGASTITLQLARMLQPAPRSLPSKIQEVWRAWRLTAGMSKAEILTAYVNRLPMGGNVYGVEAAAQVYFGTPAADLSVAQASLLAAIPNAPNQLHPYYHWQALKRRQAYVLDRMVAEGYLTQAQRDRVYGEDVKLQLPTSDLLTAPHFVFWLAENLPAQSPSQVRTTLDRPLQQFVAAQVQQVVQALVTHQVNHAAVLVIENATGEVLAYVGSPSYFGDRPANRNDGVQALRQPGSTLKPFLYQLALETGTLRPNSILADVPTHYPIPDAQLYSPTDYDETFQGPVRLRLALANSLNVPAVRALEQVGVDAFLERLRELGFEHLTRSPQHYGLGLALGSGEVSLWELARAYWHLARPDLAECPLVTVMGGQTCEPSGEPTVSAALMTDMLSDRHARALAFGVDSVLSLPFPAAVKTGTSSDFRDTWTVGFTRDYTVATWVGNFSGAPMRQVSGVTGAAPLWQRILLHLHEDREPAAFDPPAELVKRPICATTGLRPTADCEAVVEEYFYPADLVAYANDGLDLSAPGQANLPSRVNSEELRILSPRPDDYFVLPAAESAQRLALKIAAPADQPVTWTLNGQPLETTETNTLFWPMQVGTWTLEVASGQKRDRVQFQVQLAEEQPPQRGFSLRSNRP